MTTMIFDFKLRISLLQCFAFIIITQNENQLFYFSQSCVQICLAKNLACNLTLPLLVN